MQMRFVTAAAMVCLLAACSGMPPAPGPACASAYECQIRAYAKAGH
jgi:hypothetical protein